MKKIERYFCLLIILISCHQPIAYRDRAHRDSIVYHVTYRDTTIYRYDTIHIKHYIHSDTITVASPTTASILSDKSSKTRKLINPNNFGIGPSVGAYYSPFNGFDVNIGFSIQYYILSIPSFRKPHIGHKHNKK